MSPGGPYGDEYPAQPVNGDRAGRFNFPSAPSGGRQQPSGPTEPPSQGQPEQLRPRHGQDRQQNAPQAPPQRSQRSQQPQPSAQPQPTQRSRPEPEQSRRPHHPPDRYRQVDSEPQSLVRPYAMTGGRTRPRYQLAIEALVSTSADPGQLQGQLPEHQRICQLCYEVKSIAEVSALLAIPLGVARILVADLAEAGLVAIHQPGHDGEPGGQPDVTLLERVLSGLRKL